jgi:undecaprenyl phosphate-alpha-L-ara4FN deformylase
MPRLALKIDVDTERGTRDGILPLAELCRRESVPALFLFSLGPDRMGRSILRVFQPGFLKKVLRTRVASNYGLSTLLNGTLKPAPHLGRRFGDLMRRVRDLGFETGIHCYDHYRWQNRVRAMSLEDTRREFQMAAAEYQRVFGEPARAAGAPGWQCTPHSLQVYDEHGLDFASDTRGRAPFQPTLAGRAFRTPQVPTTLPTLDELLGLPGVTPAGLPDYFLRRLATGGDHLMTLHAELEGLAYLGFLRDFIPRARQAGVEFRSPRDLLKSAQPLPVCEIEYAELEGRGGTLAVQKK